MTPPAKSKFLSDQKISSVAWGDYDNDDRLDFLLTGRDIGNSFVSQLWRNNTPLTNTPPAAPTGLTNGQTVYWSVQAVDTSFAGGPFASEVSEVTIPQLNILPNTATNALFVWAPPTFGWVLQTTPEMDPVAWSNAPSGAQNPVFIPLTNAQKTFYRLFSP